MSNPALDACIPSAIRGRDPSVRFLGVHGSGRRQRREESQNDAEGLCHCQTPVVDRAEQSAQVPSRLA
jgi:hypothetical protein